MTAEVPWMNRNNLSSQPTVGECFQHLGCEVFTAHCNPPFSRVIVSDSALLLDVGFSPSRLTLGLYLLVAGLFNLPCFSCRGNKVGYLPLLSHIVPGFLPLEKLNRTQGFYRRSSSARRGLYLAAKVFTAAVKCLHARGLYLAAKVFTAAVVPRQGF